MLEEADPMVEVEQEAEETEEAALFTNFRVSNKSDLVYTSCTFNETAWAASPQILRRKATSALLDTGCTAEVCGSIWLDRYATILQQCGLLPKGIE